MTQSGRDLRVRRMQTLLREALIELLEERGFLVPPRARGAVPLRRARSRDGGAQAVRPYPASAPPCGQPDLLQTLGRHGLREPARGMVALR